MTLKARINSLEEELKVNAAAKQESNNKNIPRFISEEENKSISAINLHHDVF